MWRKLFIVAFVLAAFAAVATQPVAAQTVIWKGSYYDTAGLTGAVEMERDDPVIAFNWGAGSPSPDIDADSFSVRWGTDVYLNAGTYRFFALADDNVRIWVDFGLQPLIDTWGQNKVGQLITADITLESGMHHIQVDYGELEGNAYVFVDFAPANQGVNPPPDFQQPINPGTPVTVPVATGQWVAQYFANPNMAGSPSLIQSEAAINHNWGTGSPSPVIPFDNWSARWTSFQNLSGGNYQLRVRADDGVRVIVDGVLYINEWHAATGQTYTANVALGAGQHSFVVEFYEITEQAYITFEILQQTIQPPQVIVPNFPQPAPTVVPPVTSPTGATATITAGRLNVRAEPNPFTGSIIAIVSRNETFPVLGFNTDNSWVQLNVNGTVGWVNRSYVRLNNVGTLPATATPIPPAPTVGNPTGYTVLATPYAVNIRSGPGTSFGVIAVLPRNQTAPIVARTSDSSWWLISHNGIQGWVSAPYAPIQQFAPDVSRIPVAGG